MLHRTEKSADLGKGTELTGYFFMVVMCPFHSALRAFYVFKIFKDRGIELI